MYRGAIAVAVLAGLAGCDDPTPPLLESRVSGVVSFDGPVSGAAVSLRALDEAGRTGPVVAAATSDETGRFRLAASLAPGDFVVEATSSETTALRAHFSRPDYEGDTELSVGPFTTWAAALFEGKRARGEPAALRSALDAVRLHLGFDPTAAVTEGSEAALLAEAFGALAARAARTAGATPAALGPARLLDALVEDASADALMDGLGPEGAIRLAAGPGEYTLGPETLRAELVTAVEDVLATEAWRTVEPRDLRPLMERLRCSGSPVFPPCALAPGPTDDTPPVITLMTPASADAEVSGAVTIEARASDTESGVRSLVLSWTEADAAPLNDDESAPDALRVQLDTRTLAGATAVLTLTATNGDGLTAATTLTLRLDNIPGGVLRGYVFKGPAFGVIVEAFGMTETGARGPKLATAVTDAEARFELPIAEWRGPVLIEASGAAAGTSQYRDEASGPGALLTWTESQSLATLVPDFEPGAPAEALVVTPLTDLAAARTRALLARGVTLSQAWQDSLALIGAHFGVGDPAHGRPTSPDESAHTPPTDADRALLALACLSRQAKSLAAVLRPEAPATFTPLDLVAVYRRDLEGDAVLDGRAGDEPLGLPPNAMRVELARACAAWLGEPANTTGLTAEQVADVLQNVVAGDTSALFDPDQTVEGFDETGPIVEPPVFGTVEGYVGPEGMRGPVLVTVDASDSSGIGALALAVEPPVAGALSLVDAPTLDHQVWLLDTRLLADGRGALVIYAEDTLGNGTTRRDAFRVDNGPPVLRASTDGAAAGPLSSFVSRNSPTRLVVTVDEPATVIAGVEGAEAARGLVLPGEPLEVDLVWRTEGTRAVEIRAVDPLGNAATPLAFWITWDATAPTVSVAPTSFVDERLLNVWPMPEDLEAAGLERVSVDEDTFADEGVLEVPRQVNRWQDEGLPANPVVLRLDVFDLLAGAEGLTVTWRVAPGGCFLLDDAVSPSRGQLSAPVALQAAPGPVPGRFELSLTAAVLGFDPLDLEGPAEHPRCVEVTAADVAGNATVRVFDINAVRVAPVLEVREVSASDVRAPRLSDVTAASVDGLFQADEDVGFLGIAAWEVRNPHLGLPMSVESVASDAVIVATVEQVEVWSEEHRGGFVPPSCWNDFGPVFAVPSTWAFLSLQDAQWECERMLPLADGPLEIPAHVFQAVGDGRFANPFPVELRRGPGANPITITLALRTPATPREILQMLEQRVPEPLLNGIAYSRVRQGPGRTFAVMSPCLADCEVWFELVRGERLRSFEITFNQQTAALRSTYGRFVRLSIAQMPRSERRIEVP